MEEELPACLAPLQRLLLITSAVDQRYNNNLIVLVSVVNQYGIPLHHELAQTVVLRWVHLGKFGQHAQMIIEDLHKADSQAWSLRLVEGRKLCDVAACETSERVPELTSCRVRRFTK